MSKFDLVTALRGLPAGNGEGLKAALMGTLSRMSGGEPLPVRTFRDRFSAINREVSEGGVQLVATAGSQNVLVSIESLAELIQSVQQKVTFADQLRMAGFESVDVAMIEEQDELAEEGLVFGDTDAAAEA